MAILYPAPLSARVDAPIMHAADDCRPCALDRPIAVTEQRWPSSARPLVTVVCITYNHASCIRQAIEGFLAQETTFPVQILIHDDGSHDGTSSIIKQYAEAYPSLFIAVLRPVNLCSRGIVVGIEHLRALLYGKYIALCDGDDCWTHPRKLQIQCSYLEAHPEVSLSYHPVLVLDAQNTPNPDYTRPPLGEDHLRDFVTRGNYIHTSSAVFRNNIVALPPEAAKTPAKDFFLWLMALERGQMNMMPNCMSIYRVGVGSWSSMPHGDQQLSTLTIFMAAMEYLARTGRSDLARILQWRIMHSIGSLDALQVLRSLDEWTLIGQACADLVETSMRPIIVSRIDNTVPSHPSKRVIRVGQLQRLVRRLAFLG